MSCLLQMTMCQKLSHTKQKYIYFLIDYLTWQTFSFKDAAPIFPFTSTWEETLSFKPTDSTYRDEDRAVVTHAHERRTTDPFLFDGWPMTFEQHYNMLTSGLGVSVPVCTSCFSSVLQASVSASCLGVLDPWGLGGLSGVRSPWTSLLTESWEVPTGAEDVLGPGFSLSLSLLTDPTYKMWDYLRWLNKVWSINFNIILLLGCEDSDRICFWRTWDFLTNTFTSEVTPLWRFCS